MLPWAATGPVSWAGKLVFIPDFNISVWFIPFLMSMVLFECLYADVVVMYIFACLNMPKKGPLFLH